MENVKGNDLLGLFHQNATSFIPGTATQVTKSTDLDYDNTTSSKSGHDVNNKYTTCIYFLFSLSFSICIKLF